MQDERPVNAAVELFLEARGAEKIKAFPTSRADVFTGKIRDHNDHIVVVGDHTTGTVTALYIFVLRTHLAVELRQRFWELRLIVESDGILLDQRGLALSNDADALFDWAPAIAMDFVDAILAAEGVVKLSRLYEVFDALRIHRGRWSPRILKLHPSQPQEVAERVLAEEGDRRARSRTIRDAPPASKELRRQAPPIQEGVSPET